MNVTRRRWGATLLAGVIALGVSVSAASAQVRLPPIGSPSNSRGGVPQASSINPAFITAPGIQQYSNLYNTAILGRTLQQIPPWVYGNNPYPQALMNTPSYGGGIPYGASMYPSTLTGYPGMASGYPSTATLTSGGSGYGSTLTTAPSYGGYGGGTYGPMDPSYGFLSGTANVLDAQGNFLKSAQSARLTQTQADESRIDYRRKLIEEARYERGLLPTTEELRQQELARNLDWARHQPPIADVASAKTLNDLLHHLTSDPAVGKGPDVPLDDGVLKRINVTSPTKAGASLGLLKQEGGRLQWPQPLMTKEFEELRNDVAQHVGAALSALDNSNKPAPGTLKDLTGDLEKLRQQLDKSDMSPTEYIAARGYLTQVAGTIDALSDENVVFNFNNRFSAKNVAELVDYMKVKGLDFAPAAPGDEGAYRALQQALVAFDYGASGQATATPAAPPAPPKNP